LERQKQAAAAELARHEFETKLILKAIETPDREEAIRNLQFFLHAGFIQDTEGKIASLGENKYPSITPPLFARGVTGNFEAVTSYLSDTHMGAFLQSIGRFEYGLADGVVCTGWLVAPSYFVTASFCAKDGVDKPSARFGYISEQEKGTTFGLKEILKDPWIGVAIFEIDKAAIAKFGAIPLKFREPKISESAFIVQYVLDVGGKPLPARVVRNGCRISRKGAGNDLVMQIKQSELIYHVCDTLIGSAGAPIISQDDSAILAMNLFGSPTENIGVDFVSVMRKTELLSKLAQAQ
jgi:hypothetical protein